MSNELNFSILSHLQSLKTSDNECDIETVIALLEPILGVSNTVEDFNSYSYAPNSLTEIFEAGKKNLKSYSELKEVCLSEDKYKSYFDAVSSRGFFQDVSEDSIEYLEREAKLMAKYVSNLSSKANSQEELEKQAEDFKTQGNQSMITKNYEEAYDFYTKSIELVPSGKNSHIYYSNRAAALEYLQKFQEAVNDCLESISLNPDFAKAHSRLGRNYFLLGDLEESIKAYETASVMDPNNTNIKDSLRSIRAKMQKSSAATPAGMPGMGGGMPDLGSLGNLMKDPNMMSMAQNMMKDPKMMSMAQNMMKDPKMMESLLGGAGGGGMPDLSSLASMMGGLGGDKKPKGPFKGFE